MARKKNFKALSYTLTDDDLIAFNEYFITHSKSGKGTILRQKLLVPILTVGFAVIMYFAKADMSLIGWGTGILIVLSIYMWTKAEDIVKRQQIKRIIKTQDDFSRIHMSKNELYFGDDNFRSLYNGEESVIGYDSIKDINYSEKGLYIWLSDQLAFPVPRSAFYRQNEMEDLYKFLVKKTETAKAAEEKE